MSFFSYKNSYIIIRKQKDLHFVLVTVGASGLLSHGMHARRTHVARSLQPDVKSTIRTYELSRTVNDNFALHMQARMPWYRIEEEMKRGGTVVIRILTELVRFQMDDPSTNETFCVHNAHTYLRVRVHLHERNTL